MKLLFAIILMISGVSFLAEAISSPGTDLITAGAAGLNISAACFYLYHGAGKAEK